MFLFIFVLSLMSISPLSLFSDHQWEMLLDLIHKRSSSEEVGQFIDLTQADFIQSSLIREENLLDICLDDGNTSLFQLFLKRGYPMDKLNAEGLSLMVKSIFSYNYSFLSFLIASGASIHQVCHVGTPLGISSFIPHTGNIRENLIVLEYLLANGADVEDTDFMFKPMIVEKAYYFHQHLTLFLEMLKFSPLIHALLKGRLASIIFLLKYGADYTKKTPIGDTVFDLLHKSDHLNEVETLKSKIVSMDLIPQSFLKKRKRSKNVLTANFKAEQRESAFIQGLSSYSDPVEVLCYFSSHYPLVHEYQIYNYSFVLETTRLYFMQCLSLLTVTAQDVIDIFKKKELPLDMAFLFFHSIKLHPQFSDLAQEVLRDLLSQPLLSYSDSAQVYLRFIHKEDLSLNYQAILPYFQKGDPILLPFILLMNGSQEAIPLKKLSFQNKTRPLIHDLHFSFERMVHLALDYMCITPLADKLNSKAEDFHRRVVQKEKETLRVKISDWDQLKESIWESVKEEPFFKKQDFPLNITEMRVHGRSVSFIIGGQEIVIKIQKKGEKQASFLGHSVIEVSNEMQQSGWSHLKGLGQFELSGNMIQELESLIRLNKGLKEGEFLATSGYVFKVNHCHYFDYLENTSLDKESQFHEGLQKNISQTLQLLKSGCLRSNLTDLNHSSTRRYRFGSGFMHIGYWYHGSGHVENFLQAFGTSNFGLEGVRDPDDYFHAGLIDMEEHISFVSDLRKENYDAVTKLERKIPFSEKIHLYKDLRKKEALFEDEDFPEKDGTDSFDFSDTSEYKRQLMRLSVMSFMEILMSSYYQVLYFYRVHKPHACAKEIVDAVIQDILQIYFKEMFPSIEKEKWDYFLSIERERIEVDVDLFLKYPDALNQVSLRADSRDFYLQNVYNLFSDCVTILSVYLESGEMFLVDEAQLESSLDHLPSSPQPSRLPFSLSKDAEFMIDFFKKKDHQKDCLIFLYKNNDIDILERLIPLILLERNQGLIISLLNEIQHSKEMRGQLNEDEEKILFFVQRESILFQSREVFHHLVQSGLKSTIDLNMRYKNFKVRMIREKDEILYKYNKANVLHEFIKIHPEYHDFFREIFLIYGPQILVDQTHDVEELSVWMVLGLTSFLKQSVEVKIRQIGKKNIDKQVVWFFSCLRSFRYGLNSLFYLSVENNSFDSFLCLLDISSQPLREDFFWYLCKNISEKKNIHFLKLLLEQNLTLSWNFVIHNEKRDVPFVFYFVIQDGFLEMLPLLFDRVPFVLRKVEFYQDLISMAIEENNLEALLKVDQLIPEDFSELRTSQFRMETAFKRGCNYSIFYYLINGSLLEDESRSRTPREIFQFILNFYPLKKEMIDSFLIFWSRLKDSSEEDLEKIFQVYDFSDQDVVCSLIRLYDYLDGSRYDDSSLHKKNMIESFLLKSGLDLSGCDDEIQKMLLMSFFNISSKASFLEKLLEEYMKVANVNFSRDSNLIRLFEKICYFLVGRGRKDLLIVCLEKYPCHFGEVFLYSSRSIFHFIYQKGQFDIFKLFVEHHIRYPAVFSVNQSHCFNFFINDWMDECFDKEVHLPFILYILRYIPFIWDEKDQSKVVILKLLEQSDFVLDFFRCGISLETKDDVYWDSIYSLLSNSSLKKFFDCYRQFRLSIRTYYDKSEQEWINLENYQKIILAQDMVKTKSFSVLQTFLFCLYEYGDLKEVASIIIDDLLHQRGHMDSFFQIILSSDQTRKLNQLFFDLCDEFVKETSCSPSMQAEFKALMTPFLHHRNKTNSFVGNFCVQQKRGFLLDYYTQSA